MDRRKEYMTMNLKLKVQYVPTDTLIPYAGNAKEHPEWQVGQIVASIEQFGFDDPIGVWHNEAGEPVIVEGHGRLLAAKQLGMDTVPCVFLDHLDDEARRAYTLVHNQTTMNTGYDESVLAAELADIEDIDMAALGFDDDFIKSLAIDASETSEVNLDVDEESTSLCDRYVIPPMTILDTRQGYWRDRREKWDELGIASELGREGKLTFNTELEGAIATSVFDPVLCEIAYKWFNVEGGSVYDCFAGGSVRGIVAAKLGYQYTGIDLRREQIDANYENAKKMNIDGIKWYCDDSLNADKYVDDNSVDMVFSCPPYADLEVYSDDERDLSNMDYDEFKVVYRNIIDIACRKLKNNRFAVFVVGDVRDSRGFYRNFVDYTKECFNANGLLTYNDLVLINSYGTAPMRVESQFPNYRKNVKVHQNVLVFYKGDPKSIKTEYSKFNTAEPQ